MEIYGVSFFILNKRQQDFFFIILKYMYIKGQSESNFKYPCCQKEFTNKDDIWQLWAVYFQKLVQILQAVHDVAYVEANTIAFNIYVISESRGNSAVHD